jgi:hypothetical protein
LLAEHALLVETAISLMHATTYQVLFRRLSQHTIKNLDPLKGTVVDIESVSRRRAVT